MNAGMSITSQTTAVLRHSVGLFLRCNVEIANFDAARLIRHAPRLY